MTRALALLICVAWACEDPALVRIIPAGDMGPDAIVDARVDQRIPDMAPPIVFEAEPALIEACGAETVAVDLRPSGGAEIAPFLGVQPLDRAYVDPDTPLILTLAGVADGAHALTFDVNPENDAQQRVDPGITVRIDRHPPTVDWPEPPDACVPAAPDPVVADQSVFEVRIDGGRLGCRFTQLVRAADDCGHRITARRTWRIGPPAAPRIDGDPATGLRWQIADDGCIETVNATLARAGEPPTPYAAGTPIEWPGDYTLTLTTTGCGGPAQHVVPVAVPAGPCDRPTAPLESDPHVRGWLEISSQRMVDLSLELSARGWGDAAEPVRQAAVILARDPGFPQPCAPPEVCLTPADLHLALTHLDAATTALADRPLTRSARRCLTETARVTTAAGQRIAACEAQALALVDAWADPAARARIRCLCAGQCAPEPRCADVPVLQADPDPIRFAEQISRLAPDLDLRCDGPDCPGLDALIDQIRAQLAAGDCGARTGLSIVELLVGRQCSGAGRFRHPGLNALALARAYWPIWTAPGTAASRAALDRAVTACLP